MEKITYLESKGFKKKDDADIWTYYPKRGNWFYQFALQRIIDIPDGEFEKTVEDAIKHTEGTFVCLSATYKPL